MTFCIGVKVREGLVGVADTRLSMGSQTLTARKISVISDGASSMLLMTSGLRSVRDKVLTYFEEALEELNRPFDKVYQAANALADQVRRVAAEDRAALMDAGLKVDLHCLIGGQFSGDKEHKLYMLYPQANWVEVSQGTPYCMLGETSYGKPLLDRVLRYESSLQDAFKAAFLAFDATQSSTSGVAYPMDAVIFRAGEPMQTNRYMQEDVAGVAERWNYSLRRLIEKMPDEWMEPLLGDEPVSNVTPISSHEP